MSEMLITTTQVVSGCSPKAGIETAERRAHTWHLVVRVPHDLPMCTTLSRKAIGAGLGGYTSTTQTVIPKDAEGQWSQ